MFRAFFLVLLAGCAASSAPDLAASEEAVSGPIAVPNPHGDYTLAVTTSGSGCPQGSWTGAVSADATTLTLTPKSLRLVMEPDHSFATTSCMVTLDLKTTRHVSFSLAKYASKNAVSLDRAEMKLTQTVDGFDSTERGPYDDVHTASHRYDDAAWTPCGTTHRLSSQTRLTIDNDTGSSGSGFVNFPASASFTPTLVLTLSQRGC